MLQSETLFEKKLRAGEMASVRAKFGIPDPHESGGGVAACSPSLRRQGVTQASF